jgi:hypothetical protein
MRSFLSWLSISSFLALPSFSSVLMPQPIVNGYVMEKADLAMVQMAVAAIDAEK